MHHQTEQQTNVSPICGCPKPLIRHENYASPSLIFLFSTNHIFVNNCPLPSQIAAQIPQLLFTERLHHQTERQTDISPICGCQKPLIRHENYASPSLNFLFSTNHIFVNNCPLPSQISAEILQLFSTARSHHQTKQKTNVSQICRCPKPLIRHENYASPSLNFLFSTNHIFVNNRPLPSQIAAKIHNYYSPNDCTIRRSSRPM